jgi:hypothetical protein
MKALTGGLSRLSLTKCILFRHEAPTGGLFSLISHKVHSFSAMEALTGGHISLISHKVHSFFAMKALTGGISLLSRTKCILFPP